MISSTKLAPSPNADQKNELEIKLDDNISLHAAWAFEHFYSHPYGAKAISQLHIIWNHN